MDLKTNSSALMMIRQLFDTDNSTSAKIHVKPQKPRAKVAPVSSPFPRCEPEEKGIPSGYLTAFFDELYRDRSLDMHHVMILRDGCVIAEASFGAYDRNVWHTTYSECKSILALAVGMLVDEGKLDLDSRLIDLLPKHATVLSQISHRNLTLRHLLTMTSAVNFSEAGSVTETNWARCYFESAIFSEPGKKFAYNSMNTYMLSLLVKEVSGQTLTDYLTPRLWEPLDITDIYWETCPMGIEKGGWGLYIRPEDIAKIGQLVLQLGKWNGRQLVSERWIRQATGFQAETPVSDGDFNYGFQIWVGRNEPTFLFNGMFGQNVLGDYKNGLLVVSNAGNNELFQQSSFYTIVQKYFTGRDFGDVKLPADHAAYRKLLHTEEQLRTRAFRDDLPDWIEKQSGLTLLFKTLARRLDNSRDRLCELLGGRSFKPVTANAASAGLMPLYAQAIQNNYASGLVGIAFEYTGRVFSVIFSEAEESYKLPVGFDVPRFAELDFHREPQRVAVLGRFSADEDGTPVLALRVSFLELAGTRFIKIFFHHKKIAVRMTESPGKDYLIGFLELIREKTKSRAVLDVIVNRADNVSLRQRIERTFEPLIEAKEIDGVL